MCMASTGHFCMKECILAFLAKNISHFSELQIKQCSGDSTSSLQTRLGVSKSCAESLLFSSHTTASISKIDWSDKKDPGYEIFLWKLITIYLYFRNGFECFISLQTGRDPIQDERPLAEIDPHYVKTKLVVVSMYLTSIAGTASMKFPHRRQVSVILTCQIILINRHDRAPCRFRQIPIWSSVLITEWKNSISIVKIRSSTMNGREIFCETLLVFIHNQRCAHGKILWEDLFQFWHSVTKLRGIKIRKLQFYWTFLIAKKESGVVKLRQSIKNW